MVEVVENVKKTSNAPYGWVCREMNTAYSSLMRWKGRLNAGTATVRNPGPAKVGLLNVAELHKEIRELCKGGERTRGTGALRSRYSDQISRRDFQVLVEAANREVMREDDALERRIEWLMPGLVWSMDDTKKHWLREEQFGHVHLVMDLGSRYNLRVLGDDVMANGLVVALNMEDLFHRHGAPLFMKMDGGSNFKHKEVRAMFDEYGVIPLLSPPHYAPYNGGIERGHQEILRQLNARIGNDTVNAQVLRLQSEVSGHEVNHKRRRSLGGSTACHVLEISRPLVRLFDRRERKEVYEKIKLLAVDIAEQLPENTDSAVETAFRHAAETWMQSNRFINVIQKGKVLPCFHQN